MKRFIYLLFFLFLLLSKTESNAQAPYYNFQVTGHIDGLNGASTPVSFYYNSGWLPYILFTDSNGDVSFDLPLDSFMLPGTLEMVFYDCGMDSVSVSLALDTNDLFPVLSANYCDSGAPFGTVTVHFSDADGEPVLVNVYSDAFGGTFATDASGSLSVAVPYTDPMTDVYVQYYDCLSLPHDTVFADSDLSVGIVYTAYYNAACDSTVSNPGDVTVVVHLDNTAGVNVPVMIVTDGATMTQVVTDGYGDATINLSVVNPGYPILVMYTDCNSQQISDSAFVNPMTMTAVYAGDYCPGGAIDSCGVMFTASYNPSDNAFILEMDSAVEANAVEFIWDFGDGTIDSAQYPNYTYANNDLYQVCLYTANANGTYCSYCHVIGFDSLGNVVTREDGGFTLQVVPFGTTTGLENLPEPSFHLYPNPATDHTAMQLYSDTAVAYTVNVLNALGQVIRSYNAQAERGSNEFLIPVRDLVPGYYMVSLEIDNRVVTRSFVK
ncbi:MAG TPA: T9SS type A sorting domain-containing protein [Chitinophagales bacterium]|nr:T9SS type A sorting domain-containing protein [Chitinophagales bacterium]